MVYAPQRRHVVVSLSQTMQVFALVQHFYSPNTMVLICRLVSHINMRAPAVIQPTRSLLTLFVLVLITNIAAGLLHLLDFASGQNGGKGLILDFVGQANPASFTRIIILDIVIFLLQLTTLIVSYITNYTATLPKSDRFPYDDLLLPPAAPLPITEADLDIESGDQFRQRRQGKGPRYSHAAPQRGEVWFDEEEEEGDPLLGAAPPARVFPDVSRSAIRRSGTAPLIFNVSPAHLFNLIVRLPNPTPPRLFSGGTPGTSPPSTPAFPTEESLLTLANALQEAQSRAENIPRPTDIPPRVAATNGPGGEGADESRSPVARDEPARGDQPTGGNGSSPRPSRIPGDYWTTRATG